MSSYRKTSSAAQTLRSGSYLFRVDTPEPDARQGRRNLSFGGVQLLDESGALSAKLETVLGHIFSKYLEPPFKPLRGPNGLMAPPSNAFLSPAGLDRYASDTNGAPFSEETKQELKEMLEVNEDGNLTLEGFYQVYQLQTSNDEEETWRDLSAHGFDRDLNMVPSREEETEDVRPPPNPILPPVSSSDSSALRSGSPC